MSSTNDDYRVHVPSKNKQGDVTKTTLFHLLISTFSLTFCSLFYMLFLFRIVVRNKDLTWPEEMSQLAKTKASIDKKQQGEHRPLAGKIKINVQTC